MSQATSAVPRNAVYNALASLWQVAVAFALVPIVIGLAGETAYGLWVLLSTLSLTGVFSFLDLGLIGSVVKWVSHHAARGDPETAGRVVDVSLAIFAPLGLVIAGLLWLARPLLVESGFHVAEAERSAAAWMIGGFAIQLIADFVALPLSAVGQAFLRFGWLRALQSIKLTAFALAVVALLGAGHGVEWMPWIAAVLSWLHLPALVWLARRELPAWRPRLGFERELLEQVLHFSAKVFVLRVAASIYGNMDKLILGVWLGTVAVADYDIVFKLHALALMPVFFVTPLVVPIASAMSARDDVAGLRRLVLQGSKLLGALCLPLAVGIFLLADPLLRHWLGAEAAERAGLVQLFVSYLFFWPLVQVGWNALIGHDRAGSIAWIAASTIAANLALSLWWVGPFGLAGVIAATVVSNAVAFALYLALQLHVFEVRFGRYARTVLLPNVAAAGTSAAVVLALLAWSPPGSLVATGVYLAAGVGLALAIFWTVGLDRGERRWIVRGLLPQRAGLEPATNEAGPP